MYTLHTGFLPHKKRTGREYGQIAPGQGDRQMGQGGEGSGGLTRTWAKAVWMGSSPGSIGSSLAVGVVVLAWMRSCTEQSLKGSLPEMTSYMSTPKA